CSTSAMPSRNRSAKACEPASLSPKDTAPLTDFSDIRPRLTLHVRFCSCASPWRDWNHRAAADACPAPAEQSAAHSCRAATRCRHENGAEKGIFVVKKGERRRKKSRRSRRLEV